MFLSLLWLSEAWRSLSAQLQPLLTRADSFEDGCLFLQTMAGLTRTRLSVCYLLMYLWVGVWALPACHWTSGGSTSRKVRFLLRAVCRMRPRLLLCPPRAIPIIQMSQVTHQRPNPKALLVPVADTAALREVDLASRGPLPAAALRRPGRPAAQSLKPGTSPLGLPLLQIPLRVSVLGGPP